MVRTDDRQPPHRRWDRRATLTYSRERNMSFRRSAVAGHAFDERLRRSGSQVHSESVDLPAAERLHRQRVGALTGDRRNPLPRAATARRPSAGTGRPEWSSRSVTTRRWRSSTISARCSASSMGCGRSRSNQSPPGRGGARAGSDQRRARGVGQVQGGSARPGLGVGDAPADPASRVAWTAAPSAGAGMADAPRVRSARDPTSDRAAQPRRGRVAHATCGQCQDDRRTRRSGGRVSGRAARGDVADRSPVPRRSLRAGRLGMSFAWLVAHRAVTGVRGGQVTSHAHGATPRYEAGGDRSTFCSSTPTTATTAPPATGACGHRSYRRAARSLSTIPRCSRADGPMSAQARSGCSARFLLAGLGWSLVDQADSLRHLTA